MNRHDISGLNKNRSIFLKVGFMAALCLVIFAFNITVYEKEIADYTTEIPSEPIFEEVIRTPSEVKPKLPPPDLKISENFIPDEPEFIDEPLPELVETEITSDAPPTEMPFPKAIVTRPEPPEIIDEPVTKEELPIIWEAVEEMPRFSGCETKVLTKEDKQTCANKALLEFIYSRINYPQMAIRNRIEGTVVIEFIVEKTGRISNATILKEIGGGCGKEALRVVKEMPDWIPGRQRGKAVPVRYKLPVKFVLD